MPPEPEKLKSVYIDVVYYEDYKTYVAECMELPIIIEADTFEEIQEKIPYAINTYRKTFPEKSEKALKNEMIMPIKAPVEKISGIAHIKMTLLPIPAT